jgi:hypothetical protein
MPIIYCQLTEEGSPSSGDEGDSGREFPTQQCKITTSHELKTLNQYPLVWRRGGEHYPLPVVPEGVVVLAGGFRALGAGIDVEMALVDPEAFDAAAVQEAEKIIQAAELISYKLVVSDHEIERHSLQVKGVGSTTGELVAQESTIRTGDKNGLSDEVSDDLNGEDQAAVEDVAVTGVIRTFGKEFVFKEVFGDPCLRIAMNGCKEHNG